MTSSALLVLALVNFIAIGLLPILFFRQDGSFNPRWLATGAPFFFVPAVLLLGAVGWLEVAWQPVGAARHFTEGVAVVAAAVSIGMIAMTVGTHRVPLALWHQDDDAPVQIVTWGPYAYVRHPFYTSFLLAFLAAMLAFPHLLTAAALVYGFIALSITARREERRLCDSEFGDEYREYMRGTGRFFPGAG